MLSLRKLLTFTILRNSPKTYLFSENKWKDKQQTQQKIYVSQQQKQAMKKLVEKFNIQRQDHESNLEEFQRRLRDTMRRYRIEDETLLTRIVALHKNTTTG